MSDTKTIEATGSTKEIVEKYVVALVSMTPIPPNYQEIIKTKVAPVIGTISEGLVKLLPIFFELYTRAMAFWKSLEPYKPDLLFPSICGLIMCFFGGDFVTLIAAVEAYRMSGYEATQESFASIAQDFKKIAAENKKDDDVDADGDGVKDVLQISTADLVKRKTILFIKVADPKRLTDAIAVISATFFAVVATLKLQFAKTITLGCAIGDAISKPADKYLLPILEKSLPKEYAKWAGPVMHYLIKSFAISVAWTVQRVLSAVHSAMRGGLMFSRNILTYLHKMNYLHIDAEDTILDEVVGYGFALVGVWFQLSLGFSIPFPLNVVLFPFTFLEYALMWVVNSTR